MYERFTVSARCVAEELAESEARQRGSEQVRLVHLLLGLSKQHDGIAGRALREHSGFLDRLRSSVDEVCGKGGGTPSGRIPSDGPTEKIYKSGALREACQLGHAWIGTEHLLLALIRYDQDQLEVIEVLSRSNVNPGALRQTVNRIVRTSI